MAGDAAADSLGRSSKRGIKGYCCRYQFNAVVSVSSVVRAGGSDKSDDKSGDKSDISPAQLCDALRVAHGSDVNGGDDDVPGLPLGPSVCP